MMSRLVSAQDAVIMPWWNSVSSYMGYMKIRVRTLSFRKVNFQFKGLVDGSPWETVFREKEAEQSWQFFKEIFF